MPTKRVIIADDALDFGRMLQASLATLDIKLKITLVPSAEEALLETRRGATDLLISDVRLPGMSGFELVRKARVHYPALKIIVVTGMRDETMRQQAEAAGADAFFNKPLSMADFLDTAQALLGVAAAPEKKAAPPESMQPPVNARVGELLANLRGRLGARSVVLADASGGVLSNAGDSSALPSAGLASILEGLKAVEKTARLLGRADGMLALDGQDGDIAAVALRDMALVVMLPPGPSALRLALAVEEILAAQTELAALLNEKPAPAAPPSPAEIAPAALAENAAGAPTPALTPEPAPPAPVLPELDGVEEDLGGLEGLFEQKPPQAGSLDLDSFWEQAATTSGAGASAPTSNALSFEDALRLGITPPGEEG
jgi:CheY-like chemotaxis protein